MFIKKSFGNYNCDYIFGRYDVSNLNDYVDVLDIREMIISFGVSESMLKHLLKKIEIGKDIILVKWGMPLSDLEIMDLDQGIKKIIKKNMEIKNEN